MNQRESKRGSYPSTKANKPKCSAFAYTVEQNKIIGWLQGYRNYTLRLIEVTTFQNSYIHIWFKPRPFLYVQPSQCCGMWCGKLVPGSRKKNGFGFSFWQKWTLYLHCEVVHKALTVRLPVEHCTWIATSCKVTQKGTLDENNWFWIDWSYMSSIKPKFDNYIASFLLHCTVIHSLAY